ncbi:MAG: hypothetical protein FK733_14280 [Asgard group archaeon]|nr:hypothetical protein [Asgard group archaeon]
MSENRVNEIIDDFLLTRESFICEDFIESVADNREEVIAILKEKLNIALDNSTRNLCLEALFCLEGSNILTPNLIYEKDVLVFKPTYKKIIFSQANPDIKCKVISFLGEIGNKETIGYLTELYYEIQDPVLKKEIIFALRSHTLDIVDAQLVLEINKAYPEIIKKDNLSGKALVDDYFQELRGTVEPFYEEKEKTPGKTVSIISIFLGLIGFMTLLPLLQIIGILILKIAKKRNENSQLIKTAQTINLVSLLGVIPITLLIIVLLIVVGITWFENLISIIGFILLQN